MSGRIIDISPAVSGGSEVFPGDTPYSSRRVMELASGGSCNVTTITTTVHVGAHVDAPLHFRDGAEDAATMDLETCVGPARVVRMPRTGAITVADVDALDLAGVERLLVHSRKERAGPRAGIVKPVHSAAPRFSEDFAYLDPKAARRLASQGLRLFGIDTFSVDHPESKTLESHHALFAGGCTILEGLDLSAASPGDYELIALPLRLAGADASPVRAVLRELPRPGAKRGLPRRLRGPQRGDTMPPLDGDDMHPNYLLTSLELEKGDAVRVLLESPANVMLVDDANLASYTSGKEFEYFGGRAEQSPVDLVPPKSGRWNVIIDTEADKSVSASVRVVRK